MFFLDFVLLVSVGFESLFFVLWFVVLSLFWLFGL